MSLYRWIVATSLALVACGDASEPAGSSKPSAATASTGAPATKQTESPAPKPSAAPAPSGATSGGASTPAAPEGHPPADGKYERVTVDGVTVPMINVMEGGKVVLVDTDGKKPRTWEEQYKKKRDIGTGQFDVHKTDANKDGKFDDDAIDKEGLWVIDEKGNITKH
jgi:hypothetical protein